MLRTTFTTVHSYVFHPAKPGNKVRLVAYEPHDPSYYHGGHALKTAFGVDFASEWYQDTDSRITPINSSSSVELREHIRGIGSTWLTP